MTEVSNILERPEAVICNSAFVDLGGDCQLGLKANQKWFWILNRVT